MRLATILLILLMSTAYAAGPRVEVGGEVLNGKAIEEFNVAAFLGIPFAEPPVGDLRWEGPVKYSAHSASRDATEFAPACMQKQRIVEWYRDLAELFGNSRDVVADLPVSEDCLYLNIWTPELRPEAKLPVMVYVHGGSNRSGWSWEPNYHGGALAAEGVVVVSIAYRLGDFGFFAHPELSSGSAVANFGLWDQVAALQWVRGNIRQFGGDPDRVTLFGESAGASNILALMFSRVADNLFEQSILQSTAGFGVRQVRTLEDERSRGAKLARALGGGQSLSIAEMRALPADTVLELSDSNRDGHYHAPVIDGVVVEKPISAKLLDGDYRPRRIIIGSNADEQYAYVAADSGQEALDEAARRFFSEEHIEALRAVSDENDIRVAIDRLQTAASMVCPAQYLLQHFTTAETPAWMYRFSRFREGKAGEEWRAYHGVELPYVFGMHDDWMEVSETDLRVTKIAMSYWLQFAKTQNPNGDGTANWPAFNVPDYEVQNIDLPVTTMTTPERELCDIYRKQLNSEQEVAN